MNIPIDPETKRKPRSRINSQHYYINYILPYCNALRAYPHRFIASLFSDNECTKEVMPAKRGYEKLGVELELFYYSPTFINVGSAIRGDTVVLRRVNVNALSKDRRESLEEEIAKKAVEIKVHHGLHTYANSDLYGYILGVHAAERAVSHLAEVCLRLNPNGHFKDMLMTGVVERYRNYKEEGFQDAEGVLVRIIEAQEPITTYIAADTSRKKAEPILQKLKENKTEGKSVEQLYHNNKSQAKEDINTLKDSLLAAFKAAAAYNDTLCILTNSHMDITYIGTNVLFFREKRWQKYGSSISTGKLISILPKTGNINIADGIVEQLKYVSEHTN